MITPTGTVFVDPDINGGIFGISFPVNNKEGWFCGEGNGMIRHYINGVWEGDQEHITGTSEAIMFVDNKNGWVVGDRIKHTADGHDWAEQTNPDPFPGGRVMLDVFFLNDNEGWIVGNQGLILHTTNGGETWTVEAEGLTDNLLTGVFFTSPTNGYITGNNKTFLKYIQVSGTDEISEKGIEVYPNPALDIVRIKSAVCGQQSAFVELFSMDGVQLLEAEFPGGSDMIKLDVSHLPTGVYFCKVSTSDKIVLKKIVKL